MISISGTDHLQCHLTSVDRIIERIKIMADTEIFVLDNGPLIVKGEFSVIDGDKQSYPEQEQVALCRCGASSNKPFCDGAHAKVGFEATERVTKE